MGRVHQRSARRPGPGAGDPAGGELSGDPDADRPDPDRPDDDPAPRWPRYAIAVAALLVVALVTAWVAGSEGGGPRPGSGGVPGSTDAVRLGPTPGEDVAGYVSRVATAPPGPAGRRLALVSFGTPVDVGAAAAVVAGTDARITQALFRVPLPRVQTAVRRLALDGSVDPAAALRLAEAQAANRAGEAARTSNGRAGAIATAEAPRLAAGCACVVALVVEIDPATVPVLAARPGVRAVEVGPAGARDDALAVAPLLPEQTVTVGPVPDDGPVPPP